MIREDSPRWVRLIPSATFGCALVFLIVSGGLFFYVYIAKYRLGLVGQRAHAVGLLLAMVVLTPIWLLIYRSKLHAAAQKWGRQVAEQDTRRTVERLLARYTASGDPRFVARAERALKKLRTRERDAKIGSAIEDLIAAARSFPPGVTREQ